MEPDTVTDPPRACMACPHPNTEHDSDWSSEAPCLHPGCPCLVWQEPLLSYPMATHDMRCMECSRLIKNGQPYQSVVDAVDQWAEGPVHMTHSVCVYCA